MIFIVSVCFMALIGSLLGTLFSAIPTNKTSDVMVLINLIKFPLLFLGGVFIPLKDLSSFASILNLISPLTYLTELLRGLVTENSIIKPGLNILILFCWIILLCLLNYIIHKRTMSTRFSEAAGSKKTMKKSMMKNDMGKNLGKE